MCEQTLNTSYISTHKHEYRYFKYQTMHFKRVFTGALMFCSKNKIINKKKREQQNRKEIYLTF